MDQAEWNKSNNPYEMLKFMRQSNEEEFLKKAAKLQVYFILCAQKHLKYRCNPATKTGLDNALKNLKGLTRKKDFHQQEWLIEGQAFSADIELNEEYPYPICIDQYKSKDLKIVRINQGLKGKNAEQYLMDLAYFIDKCMAYARDSAGKLPSKEHKKFLCSNLLRRKFNYPK